MYTHINFLKSHPLATRPMRATPGAAAFDLFSAEVKREGETFVVNTGLRTSFPEGYVLLVFGRSGYARKNGIRLANGVGVIDSDYRGDLQLIFRCDNTAHVELIEELLQPGSRVAQAILMPLPMVEWIETNSLEESERGTNGFGSTGVA